ncbi:MAG: F0F1 ATP synthase subunit gamma [Anaerolineales bacterium]
METLDTLRRRIDSARDLHGIVRTMKALSAASIRQFERSVEAIGVYDQTVKDGLRILLQDVTTPQDEESLHEDPFISRGKKSGTLAVIFGTDQGMCGQFNENIVSFALRDLGEARRTQFVVGIRAAGRLQEVDSPFAELLPVPSSVDGINPAVQSLLLKIESQMARESIRKVMLYYNRPTSGAAYLPVRAQLIPVDVNIFRSGPPVETPTSRSLPTYSMERPKLLSALIGQYLFSQLYRAYAESLTSENASRLMTMQAAEKNIEERLAELNTEYHGQRQGQITSELLDIVSGVEALAK